MTPDVLLPALVTLVSSVIGYGAVRTELVRLRKLVESHALEQVETHVRVSQLEKRVSALEEHAA